MRKPEQIEDDLYRLRVRQAEQERVIVSLTEKLSLIESHTTPPGTSAPPIVNYIRNGDFSHSFDTYFHAAPVADDTRFEAAFIYSHAAPSAGQELKEDSVHSGVLVASSTALPDPGRSDAPALDPQWNRTIGYARLGSTRTLDLPLPSNVAYPGRMMYVPIICARRSANVGVPGRLYAGIWDNTAGQRNFITGSGFAISAAVVGAPAGTVSREYVIVMTSDFGRTVISTPVTVANAPNDASFISGQVYVRLSWPRYAGFIQSDIYRKTGGTYVLLAQQSTVTDYFDDGAIRTAATGYPAADDTAQRAFAATRAADLNDAPIDGVDSSWRSLIFAIQIPPTYNQGITTGKQWLRIGLDAACTGADATHGLLIDLIGLSHVPGSFAHHPDDLKGQQQPISAPGGSTQGGAGTGGVTFEPPEGGTGRERCIASTSLIFLADENLKPFGMMVTELLKATREHRLLSVREKKLELGEIEKIKETWAPCVYRVRTQSGHVLRCSETHRLITYFGDPVGTAISRLRKGDPCIVWDAKALALKESVIVSISLINRRTRVVKIQMPRSSPQTYIAGEGGKGGILSHNVKLEFDLI